jgi:predicted small lipoprotein YifL
LKSRTPLRLAVVAAFVAALALAGCGRKGGLDPPPAAATPAAPQGTAPATAENDGGVDEDGRPTAPQGQKKRLFLDWLID